MKYFFALPVVAAMMIATSCNINGDQSKSTISMDNPFLKESELPFQAPDFTKIKDAHFLPAFEEGMRQQIEEIDAIINNEEAATFENTLVEMEKSGQMLSRVQGVFFLLSGANTNDDLQKIQETISPKLAAHNDAIFLNKKLFDRVKAVYESRIDAGLEGEDLRLAEYYYEQFHKAGAHLSGEAIEEMKKLNEEEATLTTRFSNKLLAAAKEGAYITDNQDDLAGLSEGAIAAAAKDAEAAGNKGKWQLALQNTTQQPALTNISNRATRQQIFEKSWDRAEQGDENDTRKDILRLAEIRIQKAKLHGFNNYAEWKLQDQMAKKPEAVENLFAQLLPGIQKAKQEAAELQKMINESGEDFELEAWDWNYYAEKLRKEKYDLNEDEIKPYFELNSVLKNGVFYAANQLYGLTFKERNDLPVYHEDVQVYDVIDKDGSQIGLFYTDFYKRDNKGGGAWMSNIVRQSHLLNIKPVIYNVCNYTKPAPGQPALISFDDVITTFHEFGHALHGLFADQKYASLSGTRTPRDFVEFPSQINEKWAMEPSVFKNYAVHYETKEPMPEALVQKIKNAATFNQGYSLTEVVAAAVLDMQWHTLTEGQSVDDVNKFEEEALTRTNWLLKNVPTRYRTSYFKHIWSHAYSAGYYAYLWTEMLDHDAYQWFVENGGMTAENGQRFRDMILSRGNTVDFAEAYREFRGRDPQITPMLKSRGL